MTIVDDIEMNPDKHYLGRICKWGHEWRSSGKSIRLKSAGDCLGCNRVYKKEIKPKVAKRREQQPTILIDDFDFSSGLYSLGHLCPTKHNYQGQDKSVRLISSDQCFHCRQDYYQKTAERQKAKSAAYRKANREKVLAKLKEYFARPAVAIHKKQYQREYYLRNKEFLNAKNRDYAKRNRTKINLAGKRWRQTAWGGASARASRRRREARLQKARVEFYSGQQVSQRYLQFGEGCIYCENTKDPITDDHVVAIAKGGLDRLSNLVPACRSCNSSKNDSCLFVWYKKQPFFNVERLLLIFDSLGDIEQEYFLKQLRLSEGLVLNSFVVTN